MKNKIRSLASLMILILVVLLLSATVKSQDAPIKLYSPQIKKIDQVAPAEETNITKEYLSDLESKVTASQFFVSISQQKTESNSLNYIYTITLKANYFENADSSKETNYKLSFISNEDITGELDSESISLTPGQKESVKLKVSAKKPGDYTFIVEAENEKGEKSEAEGRLTVEDSTTQPLQTFTLDMSPEKQNSEDGSATFKLGLSKICVNNCNFDHSKYALEFYSEQSGVNADFVKGSSGTINAGQRLLIPIIVKADKEGTYVFKISVKVDDQEIASSKGLLVYGNSKQTSQTPLFFDGEGYAIKEDSSAGKLLSINLIENNEGIRGKMNFGDKSYALKGATKESSVRLEVYDPKNSGFSGSVGSFEGNLNKFETFSLLSGKMDLDESGWELDAISNIDKVFDSEILIDSEPTKKTISKNEVVTIKEDDSQNQSEVYIVSEGIENQMILGVIPNPWGNKLLKVKLVEGETVTEGTLEEYGSEKIGDYEVSVGSLQDEKAIDLQVKKEN